jgi:hypothetical protein
LLEKKGMMVSELLRQIADAGRAGAGVDAIDEAIIDPAPLDEEQESVLWLYAQALQERRGDGMFPVTRGLDRRFSGMRLSRSPFGSG